MYYHVQLEVEDKTISSKRIIATEIDMPELDMLKNYMVRPFLRQERFMVDGYLIDPQNIKRFVIKKTEKSAKELADIENGTVSEHALIVLYPEDILNYDKYATDITKEVFSEVQLQMINTNAILLSTDISNRVFIVHFCLTSFLFPCPLYPSCPTPQYAQSGVLQKFRCPQKVKSPSDA